MGLFGFGAKSSVSAQDAAEALKGRAVLIDVREQHEWKASHVRGAIHIPLGRLESNLTRIPKGKDVYVICASGMRSKSALRILKKAGIEAKDIKGGMGAWNRTVGV